MTTKEKLRLKIKSELGLDIENMRSLHSGRRQKGCGAYSWCSNLIGSTFEIASCYTMTELLRAEKLYLTNTWSIGGKEIVLTPD